MRKIRFFLILSIFGVTSVCILLGKTILHSRKTSSSPSHIILANQGAGCSPSPTGRNPKLIWTCAQQATYDRMVATNDPWWQYIKAGADLEGSGSPRYFDYGQNGAIAYQMTGNTAYAREAWAMIQTQMNNPVVPKADTVRATFTMYGWMYDWLYPALNPTERTQYYTGLNRWADWSIGLNNGKGMRLADYDQFMDEYFGLLFVDLATGPDNPKAGTYLNATANPGNENGGSPGPVGGLDATAADFSSARNAIALFAKLNGGSGYGSTEYNYSVGPQMLEGYMGALTATGVDHFPELTALMPKLAEQMIYELTPDVLHKYTWGDSEHNDSLWIQSMENYVSLLASINRNNPQIGPQIQKLVMELTTSKADYGFGARPYPDFFLGFDPAAAQQDWRPTLPSTYYDPAQGLMFVHQGWGIQDSFIGIHMPDNVRDDHDVFYLGDFQLWRKGEWAITHPMGYGWTPHEGEGVNSMLIGGLSSMANNRGAVAQETSPNGDYYYLVGNTSGSYYMPSYYDPPPPFLNEWTRSMVYLPSSNKQSDTVVIYDRVNSLDPKNLPKVARYSTTNINEQDRVKNAPALKQWIIHSPVAPTLSPDGLSWKTSAGQTINVSTLLPPNPRRTVIDETQSQFNTYATSFSAGQLAFQTRIMPSIDQQWDTLLNVVQASDSGTQLANSLLQSTGNLAEGSLIHRAGLEDTVVMFGSSQSTRKISSSYSIAVPSTTSTTTLHLADLDPSLAWKIAIDNGTAKSLAVSSTGIGNSTISGVGNHVVQVIAAGIIPPTPAPTPTPTSPTKPAPTVTPHSTPAPTVTPHSTPVPTATPTPQPTSASTPVPTPTKKVLTPVVAVPITFTSPTTQTSSAPPFSISQSVVNDIRTTQASISFSANASVALIAKYGTTPNFGLTASDTTPSRDHTLTLTNLSPDTLYYLQLTASNSSDTLTSTVLTFTTLATPSVQHTPPTAPVIRTTKIQGLPLFNLHDIPTLYTRRPVIYLSGTAPNGTSVVVKLHSTDEVVKETTVVDGQWEIELKPEGLDDGTHTITVMTKDSTGTITQASTNVQFIVETTPATNSTTVSEQSNPLVEIAFYLLAGLGCILVWIIGRSILTAWKLKVAARNNIDLSI